MNSVLASRDTVQTQLAYMLLAMRGQQDDCQTGHAAPYGCSDAAWDDAAELMAEVHSAEETAQDLAAETAGREFPAVHVLSEGLDLYRAALALEVASETARLARVDALKNEARAALSRWAGEARKIRAVLKIAREELK